MHSASHSILHFVFGYVTASDQTWCNGSDYTATTDRDQSSSFVMSGCDPDRPSYLNYAYNILVATYIHFVSRRIHIRRSSLYSNVLPIASHPLGSGRSTMVHGHEHYHPAFFQCIQMKAFFKIMLEMFPILTFSQYRQVFCLDADVMHARDQSQ